MMLIYGIIKINKYAPVAQLDRVLGFEPRGRRFESCRVYQNNKLIIDGFIILMLD